MRHLCILLSVILVLGTVSSRRSAKRTIQPFRTKRTPSTTPTTPTTSPTTSTTTAYISDRKGGNSMPFPRKGEYMCGSHVCKLRPAEVPKGCERGECQYNIG